VFYAISEWKVYMKTITVNVYIYLLVKWPMFQIREHCSFILHHNGAPPYFH
jgi:hypothetical protein